MRENRTYGSAGGAELLRPDPDQRVLWLVQSFPSVLSQ
jgi:hypothetical protein